MQRTAGGTQAWTQAHIGHQVAHIGKATYIAEFGEQDRSGLWANADNGEQERVVRASSRERECGA